MIDLIGTDEEVDTDVEAEVEADVDADVVSDLSSFEFESAAEESVRFGGPSLLVGSQGRVGARGRRLRIEVRGLTEDV